MCLKKLKKFLLALVLCSVLSSQYGFTDVTLTDSEAQELTDLIKTSQTDLSELRSELTRSKNQLTKAYSELNNALKNYQEQKKSYELQLSGAKRNNYIMFAYCIVCSCITGYTIYKCK